jgi:hypothetical protein
MNPTSPGMPAGRLLCFLPTSEVLMVFRINFEPNQTTDRITDLYRSLTVALGSIELSSSEDLAIALKGKRFAEKIRDLCYELEKLLDLCESEGTDDDSGLSRRVRILSREIQTLLGSVQALVTENRSNRVDSGWKR